jgi:hypothetical protein
MLPLTTANLLSHAIIGSVLENLDMERLIREVGQQVAERILGGNESVDDVARELHEKLLLRNENTKKIIFENIYRESEEAVHNVQVFQTAPNLGAARPLLRKVRPSYRSDRNTPYIRLVHQVKGTRFTDKYLSVRHSIARHEYISSPYRTRPTPAAPPSPPAAATHHKVVTDFPTFSAPSSGMSVFGTAVAPSPFSLAGGKAAFGGIRGSRSAFSADDDEDDEDGQQKMELREDSITFDQVRYKNWKRSECIHYFVGETHRSAKRLA